MHGAFQEQRREEEEIASNDQERSESGGLEEAGGYLLASSLKSQISVPSIFCMRLRFDAWQTDGDFTGGLQPALNSTDARDQAWHTPCSDSEHEVLPGQISVRHDHASLGEHDSTANAIFRGPSRVTDKNRSMPA